MHHMLGSATICWPGIRLSIIFLLLCTILPGTTRASEPRRELVRLSASKIPEIGGDDIMQAADVTSNNVETSRAKASFRPLFWVQQARRAKRNLLQNACSHSYFLGSICKNDRRMNE